MRALVLRVGLLGHLPGDGAVGNGQAHGHTLHAARGLTFFHDGGNGWGGRRLGWWECLDLDLWVEKAGQREENE